MLYAFLLDADPGGCSLDELAQRRLDLKLGAAPEQHADFALELYEKLSPEIDTRGLRKLYETIELPLAGVLARMESTGIRIDASELKRLSDLMETEIARLTAEIHELAGKPFNISSPQQLGNVLFEDLKLPAPVKYGKGKTISTAADVLEELAAEHEIVRKVLEYRQLTKLKGTYVDALPALIDRADRPPAHQLQPDRRGHRPALVVESEPAEHSRSAPSWAARSAPHSSRARAGSWSSPTTRRSSCACWRTCRATRCWSTRSATARTFTRAPRPK